jgi:hypothetical protein
MTEVRRETSAIRELAIDELTLVHGGRPSTGVIVGAIVGGILGAPELLFIGAGALLGAGIAYVGGKVFHK